MRLWWCPEQPTTLKRRARTDQLLRTVLAATLGVAPGELVFGRESHGRPFLRNDGAPDFNLTDTGGGTLIALCRRGRVGVDIERVDVELPPDKWSRIHVELDLDTARPVMSISVGDSDSEISSVQPMRFIASILAR